MGVTNDDFPLHIRIFFDNLDKVQELVAIHEKVAGTQKGRKSGVEILNKSCIVLLTACWETFIEELASNAFDYLLNNAKKHTVIPYSVLTKASNDLKNDKDVRKIWDLADDGWKNILIKYKGQIINRELDYFHVPRPNNIDDLYEKLLGINAITKRWKWKKMSNSSAIKTLNNFIDLRGEIAHKLTSSRNVLKKDVVHYAHFINCCGVILHNEVTIHLQSLIGKAPWDTYTYKSIS
jgi:hypothetical protein